MSLKSFLFGQGHLKFEGETEDGRTVTGKVPFEGVFDEKDAIEEFAAQIEFHKDVRLKRLHFTDILAECAVGDHPYTGKWYNIIHKR